MVSSNRMTVFDGLESMCMEVIMAYLTVLSVALLCLKMANTTGPLWLQIHNSWVPNGKSEESIFEDKPEGVPCMGYRFLQGQ
jgi:hypothetical protein